MVLTGVCNQTWPFPGFMNGKTKFWWKMKGREQKYHYCWTHTLLHVLCNDNWHFNGIGRRMANDLCHMLRLCPLQPVYEVCSNAILFDRCVPLSQFMKYAPILSCFAG